MTIDELESLPPPKESKKTTCYGGYDDQGWKIQNDYRIQREKEDKILRNGACPTCGLPTEVAPSVHTKDMYWHVCTATSPQNKHHFCREWALTP